MCKLICLLTIIRISFSEPVATIRSTCNAYNSGRLRLTLSKLDLTCSIFFRKDLLISYNANDAEWLKIRPSLP